MACSGMENVCMNNAFPYQCKVGLFFSHELYKEAKRSYKLLLMVTSYLCRLQRGVLFSNFSIFSLWRKKSQGWERRASHAAFVENYYRGRGGCVSWKVETGPLPVLCLEIDEVGFEIRH